MPHLDSSFTPFTQFRAIIKLEMQKNHHWIKKHHWIRFFPLSGGVALLLWLASSSYSQGQSTQIPAAKMVVRLGFLPNVTHGAALVGLERGFFNKALANLNSASNPAVTVVPREFAVGTALTEAFAAGEIDMAYVGPGPAINGSSRGMPLVVLAGASNAGAVLMARKGSGILSYKDLAGRRVAVPAVGNTQEITLRKLLWDNQLKTQAEGGDVLLTALPPAEITTAFSVDQLDAALVPEPWGALLEQQGATVIGSEKTIWRGGDYPTTLLIVHQDFLNQYPDLVRAMLRGHVEAVQFIQNNPAKARTSIGKEILSITKKKISDPILKRALERTQISYDYNLVALKEYAEINKKLGYARVDVDFNQMLQPSFLRDVLANR
jgi:NitT/TauT family transport system substrate-binding protein